MGPVTANQEMNAFFVTVQCLTATTLHVVLPALNNTKVSCRAALREEM